MLSHGKELPRLLTPDSQGAKDGADMLEKWGLGSIGKFQTPHHGATGITTLVGASGKHSCRQAHGCLLGFKVYVHS